MDIDYNVDKLDSLYSTTLGRERFVVFIKVLSKHPLKALNFSDIRNRGIVSYNLYYLSVSPYTTRAPQRGVLLTRSMARSRVSRAFRTMESPI